LRTFRTNEKVQSLAVDFGSPTSCWSANDMNRLLNHPRLLGLLCAAFAVGLGIVYMAAAGAPARYLIINLAAFVVGAAIWLGLGPRVISRWEGGAVLALTAPLMATALFGVAVDGASRWVNVGPLSVQVSLIVLPAIIVLYARSADAIGTAGMLIAAVALAAQPDRAMAGVLVAGIGAIVFTQRSRLSALALAGAVIGLGVTMLLPDALPAMPFVDRILYSAFDVHMLAGVAVVAGCFILLTPAVGALWRVPERPVLLAFGASWAALIAAAAVGNYPTPLVGYGGSAVLGYLLSVALLTGSRSHALQADAGGTKPQVPSFDPKPVELSIGNRG
jgi:cell division protein FtsW (lipid II flippase)